MKIYSNHIVNIFTSSCIITANLAKVSVEEVVLDAEA
jgi:hypothetical protein